MRVVEKAHHIDITIRSGGRLILPIIREHYPGVVVMKENRGKGKEPIPVVRTDLYQEGKALLEVPGNRLFAFRSRKGLTQKQLAEAAGVKRDTVSMLENGRRTLGVNLARKLAPPLGIRYKDLLPDENG